jgi:hypothetical protein
MPPNRVVERGSASRPGQSFSQVIKQHFGRRRTGRDVAARLKTLKLSSATLDAIEAATAERRREPARC